VYILLIYFMLAPDEVAARYGTCMTADLSSCQVVQFIAEKEAGGKLLNFQKNVLVHPKTVPLSSRLLQGQIHAIKTNYGCGDEGAAAHFTVEHPTCNPMLLFLGQQAVS
jgi:hypothetical protein